MRRNRISDLVTVIAVIALVITGAYYIYDDYQTKEQQALNEQLRQQLLTEMETQPPPETEEQKPEIHLLAELQSINEDVVGWLDVQGTDIQYPIVQTSNNEFYLKRDFMKEPSEHGSIYMDFRNDPDFGHFNTVIYGHTFPNDENMFAQLQRFRNQSFWEENGLLTVMLDDKYYEYQIFSAYVTEPNFDYRTPYYGIPESAESFLKEIKKRSLLKNDIEPTVEDHILTLSTCTYDFYDARFAVHAIRVNERQ